MVTLHLCVVYEEDSLSFSCFFFLVCEPLSTYVSDAWKLFSEHKSINKRDGLYECLVSYYVDSASYSGNPV